MPRRPLAPLHPLRDDPARLPVIWAVSVSRLASLIGDLAPEFDDRARIEIIDLGFEDAVRHIRRRAGSEPCDVVISAGSNGAYLSNRLEQPVVMVRASGFDLMQALTRAQPLSERIGVVTHEREVPALAEFRRAFGLPIEHRAFITAEDARTRVAELVSRGVRAIVGTGLVVDMAEQAGVAGILLYSAESIRAAFGSALDITRYMRGADAVRARAQDSQATPGVRASRSRPAFVGSSGAARAVREQIALYAPADATVLVSGETGTGKELVARALHAASPRAQGPFLAVNCGAIADSLLESELFGHEEGAFTGARRGGRPGLFEAAHRGSLLLDEIGEMPLPLQTRLLRVLEEREVLRVGATRPLPVDVRVLAATHSDLAARVADGSFRRDLYYRLNVLRLPLPRLADRAEDIPELVRRLGGGDRAAPMFDEAALALLQSCSWPGNVRELRNVVERAAVIARGSGQNVIDVETLRRHAPELAEAAPAGAAAMAATAPSAWARRPSANALLSLLREVQGDRARAAAQLGVSRTTLWRWLREMGASPTSPVEG